MKKLFLSVALLCSTTFISFAQEADLTSLVNEGKTALEAKNYELAFTKFSSYLTQTNNQDSVIAFNCGVCADKIKKPVEAVKYFDIAVQKKYNLANAYIGKAGALKDLKKNDEYVATLKEGLEAVPGNKALTKMYTNYYVNAGITAQKAGKIEEAEDAYKQVLAFQENNINALYSLGALYFNNGATTLKKATPLATSDRAKYDEEAAKADKDFKEAKTYLEKLTTLLKPDKPAQKKMLDNANNLLKQIAEQLK